MQKNQDIDLLDVFRWLKSLFIRFLVALYRFFGFLRRNLIVLLILLIVGFGLGYALLNILKPDYRVELVLKPNVDTTPYLYQKIEELNAQKEVQIGVASIKFSEVKVEPVQNITDLLDNLSKLPQNNIPDIVDYEEVESEFYEKTLFTPGFTLHRISLIANDTIDVKMFLRALEASDFLQNKLRVARESLDLQLEENQFSINQIDSLLSNFNTQLKTTEAGFSNTSASIFYSGGEATQFYGAVLGSKTNLLEINTELRQNKIDLDAVFKVYSVSEWTPHSSWKSHILWLVPFGMILVFILLHIFRYFSQKIKRLANS